MKTTDTGNSSRPLRRPRLHLPFEKRHTDPGEWAYDHRAGLCALLVAALMLAIAFVAGRIVIDTRPHAQTIYIDLETLAQLEAERDRLERETKRRAADDADWRRIQNLVSNEQAREEGERGSSGAAPTAEAQALEERMRANREAYEKGLAEEQAIRSAKRSEKAGTETDQRVRGRVTVSYSFAAPVRRHQAGRLEVPAYRCEGGGEVVVAVTLNRAGDVTAARVVSGGDACMRETALRAARDSQFNIDGGAPARQDGTITYIFVPQ